MLAAALVAGCGSGTEPLSPGDLVVTPAVDTLAAGAERQLVARIGGALGQSIAINDVLWSSTAPDIAQVSATGRVTAMQSGDATIVALVGEHRATAAIRVERRFRATAVAVGPHSVCALDLASQAWCFGENNSGLLGLGQSGIPRPTFTSPVVGGHAFRSIAPGEYGTCALGLDGRAWCWGYGGNGSLGVTRASTSVPVLADTVHSYSALVSGSETCGLTDGVTWCWGGGYGNGPTALPFGGSPPLFVSIAAGPGVDCGITLAGRAICWPPGNSAGQMSNFNPGVRQVAIGDGYVCAIYAAGDAACQGANDAGQLGIGSKTSMSPATPVAGAHRWSMIAAGDSTSCGVAVDGSAWCWGANGAGQLGTGDSAGVSVPTAVAAGLRFTSISVAAPVPRFHGAPMHRTCGIAINRDLYCWGEGGLPRPAAVSY